MSGAGGIVVGVVDHLADLDPEQLAAVTAPRGPVCVLAGAGTGKTRTITRRIAHLVEGGQVNPDQVLAVTFTARAAGEMRSRLRELGVSGAGSSGVQAQTFHAAALRQLRYFWPRAIGDTRWELIDSKLPIVGRAARRARLATTTEMLRDLASEIEWAKASLIGPSGYAVAAVDALANATELKMSDVELLIRRYAGRRGIKRARAALDLIDSGSESPRETWLRLLLIEAGLPRPETQIPVPRLDGYSHYFLDMGWRDVMVAVEYDGEQHRVDRNVYRDDLARSEYIAHVGWRRIRVIAGHRKTDIVRRVRQAWP